MIPTSPTTPVSWTASAAPAAATVPAVMAVAPAAAAARDAQAGLEQRRGQPRVSAPGNQGTAQTDRAAMEQARAQRAEQQAQRARELDEARRESVEHLRQTLRRVWDASAAVVEHALAQEKEAPSGAQAARALDAYGAPATPADKTTGLSRRV
ncbi:MAG: hypothetical protein IBJ14_00445 [Hydrogenophaga sp.]|nr:hypothetical protein [Hydrogenophaga sp.]